jgi:hypothetical protein
VLEWQRYGICVSLWEKMWLWGDSNSEENNFFESGEFARNFPNQAKPYKFSVAIEVLPNTLMKMLDIKSLFRLIKKSFKRY